MDMKRSRTLQLLILVYTLFFSSKNSDAQSQQIGQILQQFNQNLIANSSSSSNADIGSIYIPTKLSPALNDENVKAVLAKELGKCITLYGVSAYYNDSSKVSSKKMKDILITDDYIQFSNSTVGNYKIYFSEILFDNITLTIPALSVSQQTSKSKKEVTRIKVNKHLFFAWRNELADALFYMQYKFSIKYFKEQELLFRPIAASYLQIEEKPQISEEQRKYFVQANSLADAKLYKESIDLYNKAIEINPIAYPAGYYNLALVASLAERYPFSILCMKKYLMLMPDAADARTAQDKIYGWEAFIK